jgi:hypothetical protein
MVFNVMRSRCDERPRTNHDDRDIETADENPARRPQRRRDDLVLPSAPVPPPAGV